MTPKTQSVCDFCHTEIVWRNLAWRTAEVPHSRYCVERDGPHAYTSRKHEPVAEPASTGEPPVAHQPNCVTHNRSVCEMCNWPSAARPSEPSAPNRTYLPDVPNAGTFISNSAPRIAAAPQTSAEPQPLPCRTPGAVYHFKLAHSEQSGREILTLHVYMPQEISIAEEQAQAIEEKLHDACEAILSAYWPNNFPAAPQPVSGDAPGIRVTIYDPLAYLQELYADMGKRGECEICLKLQFCIEVLKEKLAGDAPKVEDIVSTIAGKLAEKGFHRDCGNNNRLVIEHELETMEEVISLAAMRPYSPPASQTPEPTAFVELGKLFDRLKEDMGWREHGPNKDIFYCEYCHQSHEDCTKIPHLEHCHVMQLRSVINWFLILIQPTPPVCDGCGAGPMLDRGGFYDCFACGHNREKLATPASTARKWTDALGDYRNDLARDLTCQEGAAFKAGFLAAAPFGQVPSLPTGR